MRPWKPWPKTTTPGRPVAARAILTAFSTASAPELTSRLRCSPPTQGRARQPPAELNVRLVHPDHRALVQVAVDLLVDRGDRGRKTVAEVLAGEPAGEVDVLAPVHVHDPRALCARDESGGVERPRAT